MFKFISGFFHEQSRADRDNYIKVVLDNVEINETHNFEKYDLHMMTHLGLPYDYG